MKPAGRVVIEVHLRAQDPAEERAEIRRGLLREPREISPKYFYDDRGSKLYEAICELPEYYQARTEHALLKRIALEIVETARAQEIVELGSGAATKTRLLLDAMARAGRLRLYVPFDFSESTVRRVGLELASEYPGLRVHGVVGDFTRHLEQLPAREDASTGGRLLIFLGGTIGNFRPEEAVRFLSRLAECMHRGDFFLLGAQMVTDATRLEAAYDDAAGVTAEFDRNALRVLNRLLDGDFDPEAFRHRALFDRERRWIEMRLVSTRDQTVHLPGLDLVLELRQGEEILTEISAKYDRGDVVRLLERSGFRIQEWYTDAEDLFALALARRV